MSRETPHYRQVARTIRNRIQEGLYRVESYIPSAQDLEAEFGVSNITIRKALGLLAEENLIQGRPGLGTQVTATVPNETIPIEITGDFHDWLDSASGKRFRFEQTVLDIGVVAAPEPVARVLGLGDSAEVWRMRRIRSAGGEPISYHVNFGASEVMGAIRESDLAGRRNFFEVCQERCGIRLARLDQKVKVVAADLDKTQVLNVPYGKPLFFVRNIYFTPEEQPIAVTHLYLHGDRYSYHVLIEL